MAKGQNGSAKNKRSTEQTVVELERETVRELRAMLRLYTWNTILTGMGALAGTGAVVLVALIWLL